MRRPLHHVCGDAYCGVSTEPIRVWYVQSPTHRFLQVQRTEGVGLQFLSLCRPSRLKGSVLGLLEPVLPVGTSAVARVSLWSPPRLGKDSQELRHLQWLNSSPVRQKVASVVHARLSSVRNTLEDPTHRMSCVPNQDYPSIDPTGKWLVARQWPAFDVRRLPIFDVIIIHTPPFGIVQVYLIISSSSGEKWPNSSQHDASHSCKKNTSAKSTLSAAGWTAWPTFCIIPIHIPCRMDSNKVLRQTATQHVSQQLLLSKRKATPYSRHGYQIMCRSLVVSLMSARRVASGPFLSNIAEMDSNSFNFRVSMRKRKALNPVAVGCIAS